MCIATSGRSSQTDRCLFFPNLGNETGEALIRQPWQKCSPPMRKTQRGIKKKKRQFEQSCMLTPPSVSNSPHAVFPGGCPYFEGPRMPLETKRVAMPTMRCALSNVQRRLDYLCSELWSGERECSERQRERESVAVCVRQCVSGVWHSPCWSRLPRSAHTHTQQHTSLPAVAAQAKKRLSCLLTLRRG